MESCGGSRHVIFGVAGESGGFRVYSGSCSWWGPGGVGVKNLWFGWHLDSKQALERAFLHPAQRLNVSETEA